MSIFTVSQGDAASLQHQYQQIVDTLLRELVNKQKTSRRNENQSDIRVIDAGRVVCGQVDNEFRYELTPKLVGQLERLKSTPVGGVVEGAVSKIVEVDGQIVLQSDETGKVVVNGLLEKDHVAVAEPVALQEQVGLEPLEEDSFSFYKEEWLQQFLEEVSTHSSDIPVLKPEQQIVSNSQEVAVSRDFDAPSPPPPPSNGRSVSPAPTPPSSVSKTSTEREGGLARVAASVAKLPEGETKQLISSQLAETISALQLEKQQLSQIRASLQKEQQRQALEGMRSEFQLAQLQQKQILKDLVRQRVAQPLEPAWWQQPGRAISQAWATWQERSQDHSAAVALKKLFHSQVPPEGRVYQADNYTIQRQGRSYTLMDKSGTKSLMQFHSTSMGVRVDRESVQLSPSQYRDLRQLQTQQSMGEQPSGGLAPVGGRETEYLTRVNAITNALVEYAKETGSKVQVDGKFAYRWTATPDGNVRIDAKDERGTLHIQVRGKMFSRMSDRDLTYFEQTLPILKGERSANSRATQRQKVGVNWERT